MLRIVLVVDLVSINLLPVRWLVELAFIVSFVVLSYVVSLLNQFILFFKGWNMSQSLFGQFMDSFRMIYHSSNNRLAYYLRLDNYWLRLYRLGYRHKRFRMLLVSFIIVSVGLVV